MEVSTHSIKAFNPNFKTLRFHRAMTRPFFSRERISDFDIYDKHCDTTLQIAKTRLAEGYSFDFQVNFIPINVLNTLKNLCYVGFNCPVHFGLCYRVLIRA